MLYDPGPISSPHPSDEVGEWTPLRPIDVHVGNQIQLGRSLAGISQARLAESIGVTPGQIQDFELGVTRVSAVWLFELADALDVFTRGLRFYDDREGKIEDQQSSSSETFKFRTANRRR
jgi:transcriptional regulator with XRE-family HTH domain